MFAFTTARSRTQEVRYAMRAGEPDKEQLRHSPAGHRCYDCDGMKSQRCSDQRLVLACRGDDDDDVI